MERAWRQAGRGRGSRGVCSTWLEMRTKPTSGGSTGRCYLHTCNMQAERMRAACLPACLPLPASLLLSCLPACLPLPLQQLLALRATLDCHSMPGNHNGDGDDDGDGNY